MKYMPIINKIDDFFGNSAFGHVVLFKTMELLLPRTWHIKRELKKWSSINSGHRHILDAGSGLGQYTFMLTKTNPNWSVIGADVNGKQVAHCNKVFRKLHLRNVMFKTQDITEKEQSETYNLALATDIAEYVNDDDKLFSQLYKSLKHQGTLLMYAHLIDSKNPDKKRVRMKLVEEQFRNGYSSDGLKKKLKNAGFSKVKIRLVFGLAGRISWYVSVFYPLKLLNAFFGFILLLPIYYALTLPVTFVLNYIDARTAHLTGTAMLVTAVKK